jgi:hypothetical protein
MKENKDQPRNEQASDAGEPTPIYLTGNSTLQTPEEDRKDKSNDPRKNDNFETSSDDLHETSADRNEGSDLEGDADH